MRRACSALLALSLATSCASPRATPELAAAPPQPVYAPAPMPMPPRGAAPNLRIPPRLADGSYATPNRGLSPAATLWHLRAALNVAALACDDAAGTVSAEYNRLLAAQRKPLAAAHRALAAEYGDVDAFDGAMTRLYNYYAQPAVQPGFCAASRSALAEVAAVPPDGLADFAAEALTRIDRAFTDFYAGYDRYRADLALWQASRGMQPRLAYDSRIFLADDRVAGGAGVRLAAR
jgi:hypothetical protein